MVIDWAVQGAMSYGLADNQEDALELLSWMLAQAAPVTHPQGNMRFGNFILEVEDGVLEDIYPLEHDWCSSCYGTGVTEVPDGTIPCQECPGRTIPI